MSVSFEREMSGTINSLVVVYPLMWSLRKLQLYNFIQVLDLAPLNVCSGRWWDGRSAGKVNPWVLGNSPGGEAEAGKRVRLTLPPFNPQPDWALPSRQRQSFWAVNWCCFFSIDYFPPELMDSCILNSETSGHNRMLRSLNKVERKFTK